MSYDPNASRPMVANSTGTSSTNASGSTIAKAMPVKITADGISLVDVSVEADVDAFAGVTSSLIGDGLSGDVINSGLIQDVGFAFSAGDRVFVSTSGGVTNIKPDIGVNGFTAGDWVISLGVCAKNEGNPSLIDLIVFIEIRGQL